jgi:hypothetical protein
VLTLVKLIYHANTVVLGDGGDLVGAVTGVDESCVTRVELMIGPIVAD